MQSWLISIVISFVLRQIEKFNNTIDWKKVEADLDEKIRAIIPGKWFDDEAVALVNIVLATIKAVLLEKDHLKEILVLISEQKFSAAAQLLIKLIKSHIEKKEFISLDHDKLMKLLPKVKM